MIKKNLIILFTFTLIFIQKVNSSEKDIYKKIDLFGEVLEKINKWSSTIFRPLFSLHVT